MERCCYCGEFIHKAKPLEVLTQCPTCGHERYEPAHRKCEDAVLREEREFARSKAD